MLVTATIATTFQHFEGSKQASKLLVGNKVGEYIGFFVTMSAKVLSVIVI